MQYDVKRAWTREYQTNQTQIAYPSEYVIRIFKGQYPRLNLRTEPFNQKKIGDIGCGDGRNLFLLNECGFDAYGVEITPEIAQAAQANLERLGINNVGVHVGMNDKLPFHNGFFDYLLSWNACYYMGASRSFEQNVAEFARVLKPDGYLVLSIPKKSSFIYRNAQTVIPGYVTITSDPFNIRNGEVLRMFSGEEEIEQTFATHFKNFVFGSIQDDCFGYEYHWHLIVCQKI